MPQAFHATLDARSKRYRYVIDNGAVACPFQLRYSWHVRPPLDAAVMNAAGRCLLGRHDFHSFETNWPNRTSSVRTILDLTVERTAATVAIEVEADGFLYNMVRTIAGTLVLVGAGKSPGFLGERGPRRRESDRGGADGAPPRIVPRQGLIRVGTMALCEYKCCLSLRERRLFRRR